MYCDLQSRGIKRKFGEDEESGDQTQHLRSDGISGISRINSAIVTKVNNFSSIKNNIQTTITSRILHHNLSLQHCYIRQRQQIFNISMCKLNRFRQSPDPSLLRSVLICNTLRTLEKELEREGIKINFGPNGVSFIPPVLNTQNMTLDPPPSASSALVNQNNQLVEHSNYFQVGSNAETQNDNTNGEYDKYLLDLDSSSGRVTPFHKPLSTTSSVYDHESSLDFPSNSLTQSANSAFWGSDEASDRLTSLNWSSVLNFNSSVNSSVTSANKATLLNGHETNDNNESVSSHQSSNSSNNNSNNTNSKSITSFTTLLPPSTSSATSTTTKTTTSSLSSTTLSSPSISENSITSQNVMNSQNSNHVSVINSNSIPFSNNANNEEIFGDIDLSLYDFDLLSPLSPPNVKLAPITAEELIRTISPTDSNSSSGVSSSSSHTMTSSSVSSPLSSSVSSPLSSPSSSVQSGHASHTSSTSSSSSACASNTSGFHGRYFKSSDKLFSDDRDQQAITPVMS